MCDLDLFKNNNPINSNLLFKKVVRISWEIDYDYLFGAVKDLNYKELKDKKEEIIRIALDHNAVLNSAESKQKFGNA